MANEGFLGKTKLGGERAATDDHPAIIHALPLDASVNAPLPVGTLMRRVEITDSEETPTVLDYAYKPYAAADAELPCAVVDKPCDPTGDSAETSAICVVHGTVKTRVLLVGTAAAGPVVIEKLRQSGIFAV
ncbi:MAG: hypothetical protein LBQ10_07330 [Desulfovibrio sp.]|jgi:hypothetical protein|nr:hypothetical protein [Desulfovibrio sp.]